MSPLAQVATLAAITIGTAAAVAAVAAVAAPVVAQPSAPESSSTPAPTFTPVSPLAPSGSSTASASSAQDAQYLQQAHQTNLAEIVAGHLAQQKGSNQTVKNLGAKFVTDHSKLDQALKPVAQTLGVSLPQAPNAQQQAVAAQLKAVSGTPFDRLFVTTQLAGYTQAMQASQTEITKGSNPQAVKLARDSAPVIESHHHALQAAARTLGIPMSATPRPASPSLLPVSR